MVQYLPNKITNTNLKRHTTSCCRKVNKKKEKDNSFVSKKRGCKTKQGKVIVIIKVKMHQLHNGVLFQIITSLFVPTSMVIGRHWWGLIPARAVYKDNFPTGIPIPHAPRSPRPRIRSPSVTTIARTSGSGLENCFTHFRCCRFLN